MKTVTLKPARPSLTVRHPKTRQKLPPDGQSVTMNSYWLRRLQDGDVVKVQSVPSDTKAADKPTQKGQRK